jgi:GrpB-like predicted nucleotidyltransferase (UPF0157 family)
MKVEVVPHNPEWGREFEAEAHCLKQVLGELVVGLHHIGSTAIPGLSAKPIIDVLMVVLSLSALDEETPTLEAIGYEAMGEYGIATRRYFRKNDFAGIRTHQVHAFEAASPHVERHLAFRDYLIAHPWVARDYGELKQRLAAQNPDDIDTYGDGKEAFVKEHEALALAWRSSR